MGKFFSRSLIVLVSLFALSSLAQAQIFFANTRANNVEFKHVVVGTTAALAIPVADVKANVLSYGICLDAEATATFLAVGEATDPLTDGIRIAPGQCYTCSNCTPASLKKLRVVSQAASTGYSVIQYRK